MDIIKAMNLKKYYTSDTYEVRALDGVSLTVEEGEFIAVVGTRVRHLEWLASPDVERQHL